MVKIGYKALAAADVWTYATRSLTTLKDTPLKEMWEYEKREENVSYIVSRATGNPKIIYEGSQALIKDTTRIRGRLEGTGYGGLFFRVDDDKVPGAVETILESGFNSANVKDHDDATYATLVTNLPAVTTRDHVQWDLGAIKRRAIKYKLYSAGGLFYARILISDDGTTWTKVVEVANATVSDIIFESFRYIKLQSSNGSTGTAYVDQINYYTIEVFDVSELPYDGVLTKAEHVTKVVLFIYDKSATIAYALWKEELFP